MRSFTARLLITASVVLVAFLGLTGLALDKAFRDSALSSVRDRLQTQVYMLLGAAEVDPKSGLHMPQALPEARLLTPDSGLYALIVNNDGKAIWRSRSMLGLRLRPLPPPPPAGGSVFIRHVSAKGRRLLLFGFTVSWELNPSTYRGYTFWVAENESNYYAQVNSFRRSLGLWLLGAALVLLAVQVLVLRWTLQPLRQVAREVREIETGRRAVLSGRYPSELQPLTTNLNNLVREGRARLERSRNALADLAHSLKTPLAVLNNITGKPVAAEELRTTVRSQIERMNQTVDYQLQRAAAAGRLTLSAAVAVATPARKLSDSLNKVYADKALQLELRVDPHARFYGEQGDLLEILGNLADNACKWAHQRVRLTAHNDGGTAATRLVIEVEDDGPGIPEDQRQRILARGQRADPNTPGHGIGLAVVRDLVEDVYQGRLAIARSDELGGTRVRVELGG